MNNNNSQIGHIPSEQIFENETNESDINQILSGEVVTTSQSSVQFNTANMIPSQTHFINSVQQDNNLTTRREGRRRRRQRQRERRRQEREEQQQRQQQEQRQEQRQRQREQQQRQQQEQRQEQRQRQREQQQRQRQREQQQRQQQRRTEQIQRQQPTLLQTSPHRSTIFFDRTYDHDYLVYIGFPEYMDESFNDTLFDAYEWVKMDPKARFGTRTIE